jgi:hypothetical protein
MHLHFSNLYVDNTCLVEDHELLLRVVADFRISGAGKVLYEEPEFCVVEFGVQAIEWVRKLVHRGDFILLKAIDSTDVEQRLARIEEELRGERTKP